MCINLLGYNDGVYDLNKTPLWLNLMYLSSIIGYKEFLIKYPLGANLDGPIMERLLSDIRPFGTDFKENINYVISYWNHLKANPATKIPFHSV